MIFRIILLALFLISSPDLFSQNGNNALFFVITKDSTEHIGNVEAESEQEITLRLRNREFITISRSDILIYEAVTEDNFMRGKYIRPNPFANRYIGTRSAIGPGKKQMELGTHYAIFWSLDYGLNDTYSAGLHTTFAATPVMVNVQANYKIGNQLYFGITGTAGWMSWAEDSLYFGFGGVKITTGSRNNNYTFGGGYFSAHLNNLNLPSITGPSHFSLGDFGYLNVATTRRYSKHLFGIGELWVMKNLYLDLNIIMFNAGIRILRKQHSAWTFYVATITFHELRGGELRVVPIPSISWTRKFNMQ